MTICPNFPLCPRIWFQGVSGKFGQISLGNPSEDRQRFVDAVVLISAPDWSVKLSNFENLLDTPFEFGL